MLLLGKLNNKIIIMIRETLELLRDNEWLIDDIDINIAKGLNELPSSFKEMKTIIKRKKLTNGR